jgi:hypothetical protein
MPKSRLGRLPRGRGRPPLFRRPAKLEVWMEARFLAGVRAAARAERVSMADWTRDALRRQLARAARRARRPPPLPVIPFPRRPR